MGTGPLPPRAPSLLQRQSRHHSDSGPAGALYHTVLHDPHQNALPGTQHDRTTLYRRTRAMHAQPGACHRQEAVR
ncbi:hypothetical protein I4F81_003244 [Pyropia yezoensis]|uniref:Uncharacterized protein n=1 Tax=Pyropia yezoensis TaxID=2788 RepID=A0ACC3BRN2_PYRYE|nr:hypothetical protein I4F81_003244 [Neopyropia yezoensis]